MTQLCLTQTQFLDYLRHTGPTRIDIVRQIAQGARPDLYAPTKEAIVQLHERGITETSLAAFAHGDGAPEKAISPSIVSGYQKFLGEGGRMIWGSPPRREFLVGPVNVDVAPEVGLIIGAEEVKTVIRLHLSRDPISTSEVRITCALMHSAFATTWPDLTYAVLDVRRGQLHRYIHQPLWWKRTMALLRAEAIGYRALHDALLPLEYEEGVTSLSAIHAHIATLSGPEKAEAAARASCSYSSPQMAVKRGARIEGAHVVWPDGERYPIGASAILALSNVDLPPSETTS